MKRFLYILSAFILFIGCNPEEEEPPVTSLEVRILDEEGNSINDEIEVYLFNDLNAFNNSVTSELASGFVYSTKSSSSGIALLEGLDADETYYVYIYYEGKGFPLNNYFSQFLIKNTLQVDKKTVVQIKLTPYNVANIGFYSLSTLNLSGDPIKIYFGDQTTTIGELTDIAASEPTSVDDLGVVKVLYQNPGLYNWSATGANGCNWQGQVDVATSKGTQAFIPVELKACNNGVYAFWSSQTNLDAAGGEILVVLDNVDTVGYITESSSSVPNTCNDDGVLLISRPKNKTYSYHAYSKNKSCSWQGSFNISSEVCETVDQSELTGCN